MLHLVVSPEGRPHQMTKTDLLFLKKDTYVADRHSARSDAVARDRRRPLVFVPGPYTYASNPVRDSRRALDLAEAVLSCNAQPALARTTWVGLSSDGDVLGDYMQAIDFDMRLLVSCDAILTVPGKSTDTTLESQVANDNQIPHVGLNRLEKFVAEWHQSKEQT